jgi:hypothetical protein
VSSSTDFSHLIYLYTFRDISDNKQMITSDPLANRGETERGKHPLMAHTVSVMTSLDVYTFVFVSATVPVLGDGTSPYTSVCLVDIATASLGFATTQ